MVKESEDLSVFSVNGSRRYGHYALWDFQLSQAADGSRRRIAAKIFAIAYGRFKQGEADAAIGLL